MSDYAAEANRIAQQFSGMTSAAIDAGLNAAEELIHETLDSQPISRRLRVGLAQCVGTRRISSTSGKVGFITGPLGGGGNGRGQVGLGRRNVHWFAMGTKDRFTGTKHEGTRREKSTGKARRYRGKIDPVGTIELALSGNEAVIEQAMQAAIDSAQ